MTGSVFKVHTDRFYVKTTENDVVFCSARSDIKRGDKILVGDIVEIQDNVITKVYPRKNKLIRPAICNIDSILIVVAENPKPDFLLIDKLVVNALKENLEIIFIINKSDISSDLFEIIYNEYYKIDAKFLKYSATEKVGIEQLKGLIKDKLVLLAGQSAVGKTSIINSLFNLQLKTGDLSQKILRGKHTTTYSQIYYDLDFAVIDSPGFAVIDSEVLVEDLASYYPEFNEFAKNCRFRGCCHIAEPDCMVKKAVEEGKISNNRYQRYLQIYKELKERRNIYGKN